MEAAFWKNTLDKAEPSIDDGSIRKFKVIEKYPAILRSKKYDDRRSTSVKNPSALYQFLRRNSIDLICKQNVTKNI